MKKYLYIIVRANQVTLEDNNVVNSIIKKVTGLPLPESFKKLSPGSLSFESHFVEAESIDDAYVVGGRIFDKIKPDPGILTWNDYVVELPNESSSATGCPQRMVRRVLGIVPQTQPNDVTCVQTCLAMALGVPVSAVIARYGDKALNQIALWHAIQECGIVANAFVYPPPVCRGWHFIAAPSLNMSGSEHQLLMHYEPDDGSQGITILDPAGEGKHVYQRDGSNLKSWHSLIWFNPGGSLDWLNDQVSNRGSKI